MIDPVRRRPEWVQSLWARPEPAPNLPLPTLGGRQIWADELLASGWRIQRNVLAGHHRLLDPRDVRRAWGSLSDCVAVLQRLAPPDALRPRSDHLVLLLHGIFRSRHAMRPMETALREAGFDAYSVNYPSSRRGLRSHADQLSILLEHTRGYDRVSFVAHSLGGLVARELLGRPRPWRDRVEPWRLVMIGTPNTGAVLAERLQPSRTFRALAGDSGRALTRTGAQRIPLPQGVAYATIAGSKGDGRGWNPLLSGDDDMTVSVASTWLEGADDGMVVRGVHTFLPGHPDVIAATRRYLAGERLLPTALSEVGARAIS